MQSPIDGEKCRKHGVIGWFTKGGFLDMVMDSTLSQKMCAAMLKGGYLRVNSYLLPAGIWDSVPFRFVDLVKGCDEEMDNREPENMLALANLGKLWWKAFGARAVELISRPILDSSHAQVKHVSLAAPLTEGNFFLDGNGVNGV